MVDVLGPTGTLLVVLALIVICAYNRNKAEARAQSGWVYFIGTADGPIQVGCTHDTPEHRLKELQTANHAKLKLIHKFHTGNTELSEERLHELLEPAHIRGEWYERSAVEMIIDTLTSGNVVQLPVRPAVSKVEGEPF